MPRDIHSLSVEELAQAINTWPWFGLARGQLCLAMARDGARDEGMIAEASMYLPDRSLMGRLMVTGSGKPHTDADLARMLGSLIRKSAPGTGPQAGGVHVVSGDFFTQSQDDKVSRADDNIFPKFAKTAPESHEESTAGLDLDESLFTETLASVFAGQGWFDQAIHIYSRLILKNPEKSGYFANLIRSLQEERNKEQ